VKILRPLALGLCLLPLAACAPSRPQPPKGILVILVDALRYDHVGLDGSKLPLTPAIDATGPESVVFRRAYAQASWTRPSVPSLFTGLYPSEHGLGDFIVQGPKVEGQALSPKVETLAEGLKAAGYRTALVGYQAQLSPRFGVDQGFDFYNNNTQGAPRIDKRFLGWLDEKPGQPFFAYLHYLDIHWPYCPPASTYGKFGPTEGAIDFCGNWRKLREDIHSGAVVLNDTDKKALAGRYAEEILALDGEIGQLFQALKDRGAWNDTLIVLTADHGEELMERGGIEHGQSMHEELLHVPFIWKLPASWGSARGRSVDDLIETRSLLPTLFDLVGQPVAKEVSAPSLLPWVVGHSFDGKPLGEPFRYVAAEANGMLSVRTNEWHVIFTPEKKTWELYDLVHDPGEWTNVADQKPEELAKMQELMRRWRTGLHPVGAQAMTLDSQTEEGLRSLGYLH
jgi:choline-sulfatase